MSRYNLISLVIITFACFDCSSEKIAGAVPASDSGPASDCGNGSRSGDEACDDTDLAGESCTSAGYDSGTLTCNADCTFDFDTCAGTGPTCGDDAAEGFEECDGTDLRNATCNTVGYDGGTLACDSGCAYETSGCTGSAPVCGDDNAEGLEECDGIDLRQLTCTNLGFSGGSLTCDVSCRLDTGACTGGTGAVCGDGVAEGREDCDNTDTNGIACTDLGYTGGTLACDAGCSFDVAACTGVPAVCGDGTRDGLEECDGADIDARTCVDLGFAGGTLACDSSCTFDATGCTAPTCGNDAQEPGERCDGADLGGTACVDLGLGAGNLACLSDCTFDTAGCGAVACGDDARNQASEECDGGDLGGKVCADLGFQFGRLLCAADCTFNTLLCRGSTATCGDGLIEGPEQCDGSDLNGGTCDNLGWDPGGTLVCDATTCLFDTTGCSGTGPVCSNDVIEAGEDCDGVDLGGMTCDDFGFNGGTLNCTPMCTFAFFGCTFTVDPVCGNDIAERFERCDGTDLRGMTCQFLNLGTGNLACMPDCANFDLSGCSAAPSCGDNVAEAPEVCDGIDLRGQDCVSLGAGTGTLACLTDCSNFDLTECSNAPICGNDQVDLFEICDGTDLGAATDCTSFNYSGTEAITCLGTCGGYDLSACTGAPGSCGNGNRQGREQCDGSDLGMQNCRAYGFSGGALACNANCSLDFTNCTP